MEENNNFLYNGYLLVIDMCILGWSSKCKELDYSKTGCSILTLKNDFIKFVDEKLEKDKKIERLKSKIAAVKFEINKAE